MDYGMYKCHIPYDPFRQLTFALTRHKFILLKRFILMGVIILAISFTLFILHLNIEKLAIFALLGSGLVYAMRDLIMRVLDGLQILWREEIHENYILFSNEKYYFVDNLSLTTVDCHDITELYLGKTRSEYGMSRSISNTDVLNFGIITYREHQKSV